jgi:protocatechuate 3,4-dioxygenase beta subunit
MNSSGIKRGLASSAIAALAVAGLPLLAGSAHADTAGGYNAAGEVDLVTGDHTAFWDTTNDGNNTNIHLVATGGTNVQEVEFQFQKAGDATWQTLARVPRTGAGAFSTVWVPAGYVNGDILNVRAIGWAGNNTITNPADIVAASAAFNVHPFNTFSETVDISDAPGSSMGVFNSPYTEAGHTTDLGTMHGTFSGPATPRMFRAAGAVGPIADVVSPADPQGIRTFSSIVDLGTYNFGLPNQVVAGATTLADDDAESYVVNEQVIGDMTVTADPANIATPPGNPTTITITVKDTNGKPVAGAQIASNGANGEGTADTWSQFEGYTNSQGQLKLTRPANTGPAVNYRYWVNTTDNDNYEAGTDFLRTIHVGTYAPVASSVVISSHDGDAFDVDEYAPNDIRARILDQNNAAFPGAAPIKYIWTLDPFADTSPVPPAVSGTAAPSDAQGYTDIPFPAFPDPEGVYSLTVFVDNDGTPGLSAGDKKSSKDLKAGEGNVVWNDGDKAQFGAGTTQPLSGKLTLDDGTVLPDRFVTVKRSLVGSEPGGTTDVVIAPQAQQPAGTNTVSPTEASAKTGADGTFSVAISDTPENPQEKEVGTQFTAYFGPTPDAQVPTNAAGQGNFDTITVDFLRSLTPATVTYVGGSENPLIDGIGTPGRPVSLQFEVRNAQGDLLTDSPVTIAVDHGFLTPYAASEAALKPDPAPANGADYGLWKNSGTSDNTGKTADTPSGRAQATVAIERDPGFDDDGEVDVNVTATAGGVSATHVVTFSTDYIAMGDDPLNQGDVTLSLQDNAFQDSQILPDARVDQAVGYNVEATDSFGNLMRDDVTASDDTAAAKLVDPLFLGLPTNSPLGVESQYTDAVDGGDASFFAVSDNPGTVQTPKVELKNNGTMYVDNPATVAIDIAKTTTPVETVTDTADAINWYAVDFADPATQIVFTNDEAGEVPVGTPVHSEVEIIDQKGQPVDDMHVEFVRRGPNDQQGDEFFNDNTDRHGIATYDWVGTTEGTADVSAFIYNTYGPSTVSDGHLVKKLTSEKIIFKGDNPTKQPISPKISARNNLKGKDIVTVSAKKAVGATVKLFKVVNGKRVLVNQKPILSNGTAVFRVADKNGKKETTYVAKVKPTSTTLGATTDSISIK